MNRVLIFFATAVLFSSCQTYQMNTVSSPDISQVDSLGSFILENDTLSISYNFLGDNSGMNIEIFNKLDEPLYISWAKSSLIVNNVANSYSDDPIQINGSTSSTSVKYFRRGDVYTDGTIAATATLPKDETFIPPHSGITKSTYKLAKFDLNNIDKSRFKKAVTSYRDGSGVIPLKEAAFTTEDTPLSFRNYLTFYTIKNGSPQLFFKQHNFYVSSVEKSNTKPEELYRYYNKPGNVLINSKGTTGGSILAIAGAATLAVGAGAILADGEETQKVKRK